MSTDEYDSARLAAGPDEKAAVNVDQEAALRAADGGSLQGEDVLSLQDLDPALNMKMHMVNDVGGHDFVIVAHSIAG